MKLEGRVALGLDEFMLRLGHLKILVRVLQKTYGNRTRIGRKLAEALTYPVDIGPDRMQDVGEYLVRKKLCEVHGPHDSRTAPHPRARYSHLVVSVLDDGAIASIGGKDDKSPKIWFQDLRIADRRTRSKVGAVTADTREVTNKSGVSHLVDWAIILGIANRRLGLTAVGRALAIVCDQEQGLASDSAETNPYIIGPERLIFGWLLFVSDGDVTSRLIRRLERAESVSKSDALELAKTLAEEMRAEAARNDARTSVAATRALREFQQDLGLRASGRTWSSAPASTLWHRMSSRLESLTDLGFLEKIDEEGRSRHFDYYYRPTKALRLASEGLRDSTTPVDWAGTHLAATLLGDLGESASAGDVGRELFQALRLSIGPTGVHIGSYALVAASLALMAGKPLSVTSARDRLIKLAIDRPEIVRLTRGYSGSGAEFASIVVGKLEKAGEAVFAQ